MTKPGMQIALCLVLASCGSSSSTTAQPADSSGERFAISPVATFDNPWALAFLPGTRTAIVTEKPGHIWLVDAGNGQKQPVAGAPRVLYEGQGGLLDVVLSPTFAQDGQVYLTYSEPSPNGGSGLALARARIMGARYPYYLLADSPAGQRKEAEVSRTRARRRRPTATSARALSASGCRTSR